jgi:sphingomyelin phosphodiesterase
LWEYSPRATSGLLFNVTAEIRARFPNTPVFPSVGNHEGVPVNAFPASAYWLYETLARVWEPFGLEAQSLETVKKHGYVSCHFSRLTR